MTPKYVLKKLKTLFLTWWPTGLTLLVVLYATLWPDPVGADEVAFFPGADKLIHAIMMGGLASAVIFDRRRSGRHITNLYCMVVFLSVIVFSYIDECAQQAMGLGRTFDSLDLGADAAGTALGIVLARPVINRIFRHRN